MTLPVNSIVLASGACAWAPPAGCEFVLASALYDPRDETMRIILEGVDQVGDEVRCAFYWDPKQSAWTIGDYQRRHAMLLPIDWTDEEDAA